MNKMLINKNDREIQIAKAIWISPQKSTLPKNGTWHNWLQELHVFINYITQSFSLNE